jgi:hypothetical protein
MDHPENHARLVRQAQAALNNTAAPAPFTFALRYKVLPAFDKYASWTVFASPDAALVREAVWDRGRDNYRFYNPMEGLKTMFSPIPTLAITEAPLDPIDTRLRLNTVKTLAIPEGSIKPKGITIDGMAHYLDFANDFGMHPLKWMERDSAWAALWAWLDEFEAVWITALKAA